MEKNKIKFAICNV